MKILMIGGTGVISSSVTEACLKLGMDVYLMNRGETRLIPEGAKHLKCDVRDSETVNALAKGKKFDSVINWIGYNKEHVASDYEVFREITKQYIFISTASAYLKPVPKLPVQEYFDLGNPAWQYSRDKIEAENYLIEKFNSQNFPVTIVRPSHTYDKTKIPIPGYWTTLQRILDGKPVIIHGDGNSLWTLTHTNDFAKGFVPLIGNEKSIGEAFNITSDEYLTWDNICKTLANALGKEPKIVHVPSDYIYKFDKEWGEGLLGDKAWSMIFDNSKIKTLAPDFETKIPFKEGAKEIVNYYLENKDRQAVNEERDKIMDKLAAKFT